jgi:trk system potassium uptake protein TrkA
MYIIVVGAGKMGYHLTKALLKDEHEVIIVERSAPKCEAIREELGSMVIVGDGCEESVLREAGASRADVFITVTGVDEDNLVACQIAKHRFQVGRTISLINNPSNEKLFVELGVDVCVSSTDIILSHIEEELPEHSLVHFMALRGSNREIVGIRIPPDAAVVGQVLGEVPIPDDSLISFVLRKDGTLVVPDREAILGSEDEVVAITTAEGEEALRDVLTGIA